MKKIISFLMVLCMVTLLSTSALAEEPIADGNDGKPQYIRIWENPNSGEDLIPETGVSPRYGYREVTTVVATETASVVTTPDGQPSGGFGFPSGGGIYVNTSGGGTVSVGLSVSWNPYISVSISKGLASDSAAVGGVLVSVPANSNHYIVKLRHNYTVRRIKSEQYEYNVLIRTVYVDRPTLDSIDAYIERV